MECGQGDLHSYNAYRKVYNLPWREAELEELKTQLFNQLVILKKLRIYHRDIKPSNIILSEDGKYKLTDFDSSELFEENEEVIDSERLVDPCGTRGTDDRGTRTTKEFKNTET